MKINKIGIYDDEITYASRLMEVLNARKQILFEAEVFTAKEKLLEYLGNHKLDILLVQDSKMFEELQGYSVMKIIILSKGDYQNKTSKYPVIYKYQSSDAIIREIMNYYAGDAKAQDLYSKRKLKIYGIYSPVRQINVTAFSFAIGQHLLKKYSVLYLNLELFSGIQCSFGSKDGRSLSELMYYINQGTEGIVYFISAMAEKLMGMDWILPLESPEDLQDIKLDNWLTLFKILQTQSNYEVLIVQVNEAMPEFCRILEACDKVFMPVFYKESDNEPIEEYKKYLIKSNREPLNKKTIQIQWEYEDFNRKQDELNNLRRSAEMQRMIQDIMQEECNEEYG